MDPRLLGFEVDANLWLSVPPGALPHVGTALAARPGVHAVAVTTGPTDLLAAVFSSDPAALYRFLSTALAELPVTAVDTTLVGRAVERAGLRLRHGRIVTPGQHQNTTRGRRRRRPDRPGR
ncbi:Lrp/AsnC family transcriptional regulator [Micromonospora citrea]|uniref:Lrp/AsnC family transcriptional regulator n=1 Tax=Micromonospora citrea TaxID=47855 RepID=UPI00159EFE0B|nr:Lrp/AsnC ligand binding domain-containing protein [Micromonospora citrea]